MYCLDMSNISKIINFLNTNLEQSPKFMHNNTSIDFFSYLISYHSSVFKENVTFLKPLLYFDA